MGLMGLAGIGIQASQTNEYLRISEPKSEKKVKISPRKAIYLNYAFILLFIVWFFRDVPQLLPICISIFFLVLYSSEIHKIFGMLLREKKIMKLLILNLFLWTLLLLSTLLQMVYKLDFWIYISMLSFSYFIFYLSNRRNASEIISPIFMIINTRSNRLSAVLIWFLSSVDLLIASRLLGAEDSRQYYYMSLVTKLILIYYISMFYTPSDIKIKNFIFSSLIMNMSVCILFISSSIYIATNTSEQFPLSGDQFMVTLMYGNVLGNFLILSKLNMKIVSKVNQNLVLIIIFVSIISLILLFDGKTLTPVKLYLYLIVYFLMSAFYLNREQLWARTKNVQ